MDVSTFLFDLFVLMGIINIFHMGMYLAGANLYDVQQFKRQRLLKRSRRVRGKRPLVSIIIPAHNEEKVIERCLESIRKSSYRKVEIIVHNDRSTDQTARIVRKYSIDHPWLKLRLVNRRHQAGKAGGVNYCAKKYAKGELIMILDADSLLDKQAVKNAVSYFRDKRIMGVAANVRILDEPTVLGLLQKFEHMIGYRSKKFYSLANCEFIIGGVASTYRADVMRKVKFYDTDTMTEDIGLSMKVVALGNKEHRIVYAADVVARTEGVQSFKALLRQRYRWKMGNLQNLMKHMELFGNLDERYSRMLTLYRMPMAFFSEILLILEPIVLGYLVYLSILFHTPALFVGAYFCITIYTILTLWPDEHTSIWRKLVLSVYTPVLYFIFYIMSFVQIVSILRCLLNVEQMLRRTRDEGKWVSPERSGQQAQLV